MRPACDNNVQTHCQRVAAVAAVTLSRPPDSQSLPSSSWRTNRVQRPSPPRIMRACPGETAMVSMSSSELVSDFSAAQAHMAPLLATSSSRARRAMYVPKYCHHSKRQVQHNSPLAWHPTQMWADTGAMRRNDSPKLLGPVLLNMLAIESPAWPA